MIFSKIINRLSNSLRSDFGQDCVSYKVYLKIIIATYHSHRVQSTRGYDNKNKKLAPYFLPKKLIDIQVAFY